MKLSTSAIVALAGLSLTITADTAVAGPFVAGNLVVLRVSNQNTTGSGSVILDEYTTAGAAVGNTIALPTSGSDAISLPNATNHDRHLHRSTDGRFLTFGAYNAAPSAIDPSTLSSASTPRVAGLISAGGGVDLSNRFADAYDATGLRSVYTTDGTALWLAGDNAGGATASGSLRYSAYGSNTTTNISRTQNTGGSPTTDNVRDLGIFDGQLFNCSGSSSSLGRGVFRVGSGLPTSGLTTSTQLTPGNTSASSFYFVDADPTVPGVDTLYTVVDSLNKYSLVGGSWVARGSVAFSPINNAFDHIVAGRNADGSVSIYASGTQAVVAFTDAAPLTSSITGLLGTTIITAQQGYTLGGIEFTPVPAPGAAALLATAGIFAARRRRSVR